MGVAHFFDLFGSVSFLSIGGGIDVMVTKTFFSEEVTLTSRAGMSR